MLLVNHRKAMKRAVTHHSKAFLKDHLKDTKTHTSSCHPLRNKPRKNNSLHQTHTRNSHHNKATDTRQSSLDTHHRRPLAPPLALRRLLKAAICLTDPEDKPPARHPSAETMPLVSIDRIGIGER
jgi:hypothetical protein